MSLIYCGANFEDDNELLEMARIHESAPLNWNPDYKITDERLKYWVGFFKENNNEEEVKYILAKNDNKIVGLHWIKISEKYNTRCAKIDSLWVHDDYRKKGIGAEIKRQGEVWAKENGAKFIVTEVFYSNQRMIDFNLKQGFEARQVEMIKDLK
jgi:GNAT superfamily N-acetyltransferase